MVYVTADKQGGTNVPPTTKPAGVHIFVKPTRPGSAQREHSRHDPLPVVQGAAVSERECCHLVPAIFLGTNQSGSRHTRSGALNRFAVVEKACPVETVVLPNSARA